MDIQKIQPAISAYVQNVKTRIHLTDAFLVGSTARNQASDTSDIDILLVSQDFSSLDPDERSRILYRASVGFPYDLHVYGVTPDELMTASPLTTLGQMKIAPKIRLV